MAPASVEEFTQEVRSWLEKSLLPQGAGLLCVGIVLICAVLGVAMLLRKNGEDDS